MSANNHKSTMHGPFNSVLAALAIALLCVVLPTPGCARDFWSTPSFSIVDPLLTRPGVLDSGVILPGDAVPVQCVAANDFTAPITLSEAVDMALCNNPQIKAAWAAIKVQAGAVGEARAAYLPTISATANHLRTRTAYPDTVFPATSILGSTVNGALNWRLFDFGTRVANRQVANSLLVAALATHDAALQTNLASTIQAYFDVQSTRATWQAKDESETIAKATLESAKRREANGTVAQSDSLQATTALARAALDQNRAFGNYHRALSVLIYVMGLPAVSEIVLAEEKDDDTSHDMPIDNPSGSQAESLDAWLRNAQESHPAIRAARAQWQAAQSKVDATRGEGLPTVDFSTNFYKNGYPGQGISATSSHILTVGISVTVPIFDGFSSTYKIRGAQAQAEQRNAALADTEQNVLMEVVKSHADAVSSLKNLQASRTLLNAAQDALATSRRKYNKGAADILEILNTQAALADARQERIRCLAEWRSARLRLMANTGLLGTLSILADRVTPA